MTASGARRTDASGTCGRPESSARLGVRVGLAAALVLLVLTALVPAGPAHAQTIRFTNPAVTPVPNGLLVSWSGTANTVQWRSGAEAYSTNERVHRSQTILNNRSYTIPNLVPGRLYEVMVSYCGSTFGNSCVQSSRGLRARPLAQFPQPQHVILTPSREGNKLLVRWLTAIPGANNYNVIGTASGQPTVSARVTPPKTEHTLEGLTPGTAYRVRVQARDRNNKVIPGATGEETATPLLPPVTNFSIGPAEVPGQPSGTVLKATWDEVQGAEYYAVQFKTADGEWPDSDDRPTNNAHIITGLTADTLYALRVRAVNATDRSTSVWSTGYVLTSTVPAPADFVVATSASTSGMVVLDWTQYRPSGKSVSQLVIEYWSGSFEDPDDFGAYSTSAISNTSLVRGLRPGTGYTFRMYAEFTDGTRSPNTNTVTHTTIAAAGAPSAPSSVTATADSWDSITVSWAPPAASVGNHGVTGYEVQFQTPDSSGTWTDVPVLKRTVKNDDGEDVEEDVVNPTTSTQTVYGHGGLTPNTRYRYQVRAINGVGKSAWRTSSGVYTSIKPFGFEYDINERYSADDLEVPTSKVVREFYTAISGGIAIRLPEVLDGRTPVSGATYTLAPQGGGDLPDTDSVRFDPATRILVASQRSAEGHLIGGFASHYPLTLVWKATHPDGWTLQQSFTLTYEGDGASGDSVTGDSGDEPGAVGSVEGTPPTAEAGGTLTGKRGGAVMLKGSGTKHAQGSQDALTYSWRIKSASHPELLAGTKWLKNAGSATATYSVPRRKEVTDRRAIDNGQTIEFELTVTDGDGETATDTVTMTIKGSTWKVVSLSVADATAKEDAGSLAFTVLLSAASRDPVTVAYATSDGTALAGSDYTAANGTLTFQPGQTGTTVTVTLLDDAHDEGKETFTLTLSNPTPAKTTKLADATATGTITNTDPLQRDWLARFGRTAAADAIAAVTARMETPRSAPSHLTLGGHRVPLGGSGEAGAGQGRLPTPLDGYGGSLSWSQDPYAGATRSITTRELLTGTSFRAVVGEGVGPQFTSWGQGASVSGFSGTVPGLSLRGESATGAVGMDYESGDLLTGFAMVHSLGEGTAEGSGRRYAMGSTVATALPYLRWQVSERVSMWSLAGSGTGHLTLDLDDGAAERYRADLTMRLAAAGMRSELLTPTGAGGFALALKADAFWVRTESDAVSMPGVGNLAASRADASRVRAVLDGSRTFALAGGGMLTPHLELGVRHDGGDAETGTGVVLGAGLGYADPSRGLDMALRVHGLAVRAEDGHGEWGVSGSLRLAPGVAGRGFSMSLTPSYGADQGGSGRLWMQPGPAVPAANGDAPMSSRFDAEVGYGVGVFGGGYTGTPNVGFGLSDTAREYRMGWRLNAAGGVGRNFELNLDVTRREEGDGAEHGIGARLTTRW